MIPYTDWMRVVEDGVEAGEVWVRIGSVTALRSLVFVYGGAKNRFPEWFRRKCSGLEPCVKITVEMIEKKHLE